MPRYDYKCKDCEKPFFIICGISDNRDSVICEYCKSKNVSRLYNAVILKRNKETNESKSDKKVEIENTHNHDHKHDHSYGSHCSPEDEYL